MRENRTCGATGGAPAVTPGPTLLKCGDQAAPSRPAPTPPQRLSPPAALPTRFGKHVLSHYPASLRLGGWQAVTVGPVSQAESVSLGAPTCPGPSGPVGAIIPAPIAATSLLWFADSYPLRGAGRRPCLRQYGRQGGRGAARLACQTVGNSGSPGKQYRDPPIRTVLQ